MYGALAGDIIGSPYNIEPTNNYWFSPKYNERRITKNTILMTAVAEAVMLGKMKDAPWIAYEIVLQIKHYGKRYPSYFNGPLMWWIQTDSEKPLDEPVLGVPIGLFYDDPNVIKGIMKHLPVTDRVREVADCTCLAHIGQRKDIQSDVNGVQSFLKSDSVGDAIRTAVASGEGSEQAAIAGGIAEAYYGQIDFNEFYKYLPDDILMVVGRFNSYI